MSTTEVEVEAKQLGWAPKEEFRGDEKNWVDAETFVNRGKQIMPILKANNQKLERELAATKAQLAETKALVEASQESIKELKTFNSEVARERAKDRKAEIVTEIAAAREAGDVGKEVDLTTQLSEQTAALKAAEVEAAKKPEVKVDPKVTQAKAEFDAWAAQNDWYGNDDVKTGLANGIAAKLRKSNSTLTGVEFYQEVAKQVNAFGAKAPPADKVEGGGRGNNNASGGTSYADLPSDARASAEKLLARGDIKVGKGRFFESAEAFRNHYAEQYFK